MATAYSISGDEPVFTLKPCESCILLELVEDPTAPSYESKQHEYNRIYTMLGETDGPCLLFDFSLATQFDPVLLGIIIELTNRSRALNGDAALASLTPAFDKLFGRLMRLQPVHKRASWELFSTVDAALEARPWPQH